LNAILNKTIIKKTRINIEATIEYLLDLIDPNLDSVDTKEKSAYIQTTDYLESVLINAQTRNQRNQITLTLDYIKQIDETLVKI
jgi:hypothetical protein